MRKLSPAQRERERGERGERIREPVSLSLFSRSPLPSLPRARVRTEEGAGRKVEKGAQELMRGGEWIYGGRKVDGRWRRARKS